MSVDIEYRPEAGGQFNITDKRRRCASLFAQQWPLLAKIDGRSPSESQARVLLRKDGQPDRRQFTNGRPFKEKQSWEIYGEFAVANICGFVCVVSSSDVDLVEQHRWYLKESGQNHYAATGQGFFMHRMLVGLQKGDGTHTDHRDGFGLNNWRDNLRIAVPGQNAANRRKHKVGASRFKGLTASPGGKWRVYVGPRQSRKYLGLFDNEVEAAKAYDTAALEIFGEFALLNFPTEAAA